MLAIGVKDTNISNNPKERTKKAYAMEILNEILFSQSSKFYNDLYNENLISQDMSSGAEHTKQCSFNVISTESQEPETVYNRFVQYIEETKKTLNWIVKYDLRNICCSTYRWALRNKWKI